MSVLRALMALLLALLVTLCGREAQADRPRVDSNGAHPRFLYPGFEGSLSSINWQDLGHDLALLHPLLVQGATHLREGSSSDRAPALEPLQRSVRQHVNRMASQPALSGTGPHGVFMHPAILVNAIHFTLDECRKPLTAEQAEELFYLGSQFVAREQLRVEGARAEPLALARLLVEMRLRGEMLGWARATLTPKQQSLLQPTATRDLVGWSYFSAASVLSSHARPVAYAGSSELLDVLVRWHAARFGFGKSELPIVRVHLKKFVDGLPAEPALQKRGVICESFAVKMAEATAQLRRTLLAEKSFTWAQRDRMLREKNFCVPVRIAAPLR